MGSTGSGGGRGAPSCSDFLAAGFLRAAVFLRVVVFLAAGFLRAAVFLRVVVFLAAGFLRAAVFLRVVVFLAAGFLRAAVFLRVVAFLAAGFLRAAVFLRVVVFLAAGFLRAAGLRAATVVFRAADFLRVALLALLLLAGIAIPFLIVGISPFILSRRGEVPKWGKDRGFPLRVRLAHGTVALGGRLQQSGETDETGAPRTRSSGALVRPMETHETSAVPLPRWVAVRIPSSAPRS